MTERSSAPDAGVTPEVVASFRSQLTVGEDVVDPTTWAGSVPVARGIAPRVRVGRSRWFNLLWLLPIGFVVLIVAVAVAKGLRELTVGAGLHRPVSRHRRVSRRRTRIRGFPLWVGVQHFFNLFLMIFIIRSGLQILSDHPRLYWTRHSTPGKDWFRIQKPVPAEPLWTAKQDSISLPGQIGLPGLRHSIGLARWWHLGVDTLWLLNGVVFYVLLFATGQWRRLVPTSWDVFPNALSVLIQYLSLDWPTENGWVAYNSLQLIAYFITIFVAAPLALITGLGMSPALSTRFKRVSRVLSIQTARSLHFLVLVWFLIFIVMHVAFVFTTGLLRNLNHIYAGRDDDSWIGFWRLRGLDGRGHRRLGCGHAVHAAPPAGRAARRLRADRAGCSGSSSTSTPPPASTPRRTSRRTSGTTGNTPTPTSTRPCSTATSRTTGCGSAAWSTTRSTSTSTQLRALPHHEQITQHFCIQGWSGVAKWGGVSMQTILDLVQPQPEAKWVVFYSLGDGPDGGIYYDAHPIEQMRYHLTMLAYDMNDEPLSFGHGAPLRLRNEIAARLQAGEVDQGHRVRRRTSPTSAAATAATTKTTSSSATGNPSSPTANIPTRPRHYG